MIDSGCKMVGLRGDTSHTNVRFCLTSMLMMGGSGSAERKSL